MDRKTLYVSDLDGTLLDGAAALSRYTREALNELIGRGMRFTYATARSYSSASRAVKGLKGTLPVITYNGSAIVDPVTGMPVRQSYLEPGDAARLLSLFRQRNVPVLVYAYVEGVEQVSWLTGNENGGIRRYLETRRGDRRLRPVGSWEELAAGQPFYFTAIGPEEEMRSLYRELDNPPGCGVELLTDIYDQREWWLEIRRGGVDKAAALEQLKSLVGAERVVSFGDHGNDLPMFRASDECYAVSNACTEVREAATGIIGSNLEDGVARFLLERCRAKA